MIEYFPWFRDDGTAYGELQWIDESRAVRTGGALTAPAWVLKAAMPYPQPRRRRIRFQFTTPRFFWVESIIHGGPEWETMNFWVNPRVDGYTSPGLWDIHKGGLSGSVELADYNILVQMLPRFGDLMEHERLRRGGQ